MTKTKRQLRAEAIERLKNLKDGMFCYTDAAAVVGINGYVNANMFRDALIDLLTDEEIPKVDVCAMLRQAAGGRYESGERIATENGYVMECLRKLMWESGEYEYAVGSGDASALFHLADMIKRDYVSKDDMDGWLKDFQLEHGDAQMSLLDPATLKDLWTSIADDTPLGYEASKRLADWLRVSEITLERDYVRREQYEGLEHANKRQARKIRDAYEANSKLKVERDELKTHYCSHHAVDSEFEKKVEQLELSCNGLREQRDHWLNIAVGVYRRFYPSEEYGVPNDPTDMINDAIDAIERERDEWKAKAERLAKNETIFAK